MGALALLFDEVSTVLYSHLETERATISYPNKMGRQRPLSEGMGCTQ